MAAIIRQCSRVTLRSLHSFPRLSRSSNQVVLSPLLRNSVKIEWSCNFNAKYLCSFTKPTIDNAQLNATAKEAGGESGLIEIGSLSNDSDDSELISSSSNDLFRISQRLGSVRREETLLEAFEVIKGIEKEYVPALLVYQLIRNCGKQLFTSLPERRTQLVKQFWSELKAKGISFGVNHYNVLLSVHLQNHHSFDPLEILEEMKGSGIEPNQQTLVLFIQAFCENGDMAGSLEMLGMMKTLGVPVTEKVYASLITGYGRSGDMNSAMGIMTTMRENNLEPGMDTYMALLIAYSETGDLDNVKKVLDEFISLKGMCPAGMSIAIIEALARAEHYLLIPQIMKEISVNHYVLNSELVNVIKNLISRGLYENVLGLLKAIPRNQGTNSESSVPEVEFIKQLVLSVEDLTKLVSLLEKIDEAKIVKSPYEMSLNFSYGKNDKALSLAIIEAMTRKGLKIRPHYFYPMMVDAIKNEDGKGAMEILSFVRIRNLRLDNKLIYYAKKALKWEEGDARSILSSLKSFGEEPPSYESKLTALLLLTDRLDLDEIKKFIESSGDVVESDDLIPFLELLIKRDNRIKDAVEVILFAEKKSLDVEKCVFTLIGRISRTKNSSAKLVEFIEVLFKKLPNIQASGKLFSRVLSALGTDDTTDVFFEFLRIMKRNNVEPDVNTYRAILQKASNMGRKEAAEFAFNKVNESFPNDPKAYSYLLLAHAKNNVGNLGFTTDHDNRTKITSIFRDMVEKGLKPFDVAISHAIIAYVVTGNIEMADTTKEKYGAGSRANVVYSQYLRYYSKKGDVQNCERIISEMKEMNCEITSYTYHFLLQAYRKHGNVEKIKTLVAEMKSKNMENIFMNYSELMMTQLKCKDIEGAWEIYKNECQSIGRFPSDSCCVHLMRDLGSIQDVPKLEEFSKDITQSKTLTEVTKNKMRHGLVLAFLEANAKYKAKEIVDIEGFNNDYEHYKSVGRNAAALGQVELLRNLMSFLKKKS
ncbi:leucine-rich PPR motif-containing protein, mitochondrial-like [Xenia sp. Carnegie-2017]|uniref:leucine-rich PPR motif-containing protein, mitochondrial-like n=1 Tax=Xenia sp. Carnegie-2017 TaxID=2897299 RepID=UPI001F03FF83|nr:leucine-rich PPR motif-containing protein, mitochondrial-like [Xenia sp. Carnegie-2017]XP_046859635.1 leucine-rich PPR motif-containing protein, mitochondrial-like [Xenia sp. Carnegie-2017]